MDCVGLLQPDSCWVVMGVLWCGVVVGEAEGGGSTERGRKDHCFIVGKEDTWNVGVHYLDVALNTVVRSLEREKPSHEAKITPDNVSDLK